MHLAQLEFAMQLDCSERLIRKMEKSERVSLKQLSYLCSFLAAQGIDVNLNDLVVSAINPVEVVKQWFRESFEENTKGANQKWFSDDIALLKRSPQKLKALEGGRRKA